MNKSGWIVLFGVVGAAACGRDDSELERKIDALTVMVSTLDKKVSAGTRDPRGPARQRRPEPAPEMVFAVPIAGLPFRGAADAPVTIVEGYEYACPACNAARKSIEQVLAEYGDKVRVVYKPYIVHPDIATDASLAVCAAHQQGKFEAMDQLLWDKAFGARNFKPENIAAIASEAGLDARRYTSDVEACREQVKRHQSELQGFGQGATPTFFINGRYVLGASPDKLRAVIQEELARADERIKAGTAAADYYQRWVLDKGARKFEPKPAS